MTTTRGYLFKGAPSLLSIIKPCLILPHFSKSKPSSAPLRTYHCLSSEQSSLFIRTIRKPACKLLQIKVSPYYRTSQSQCFPKMITIFRHNRRVWEQGEGQGEKENNTCKFQKICLPSYSSSHFQRSGPFPFVSRCRSLLSFLFFSLFSPSVFFLFFPARRI